MSSKTLTGWLLIGAPILTFVVIGILYSQLVGDQETAISSVDEMMAEPDLARILLVVGSIVLASMFGGLLLLTRSMQGEDKSGATYASAAGIAFGAITAVAITATGLSLGSLETSAESKDLAVNIEAVSQAMFSGIWVFWGLGNILLGTAIIMQKNLHVVMGWIFVAFGAFMLISSAVDLNIDDNIGLVVWLGLTLAIVASGVLTLRGK